MPTNKADPIMQYFKYNHLPAHLKGVSQVISNVAELLYSQLPDGPEKSSGLRKLLEAKDCLVRSALNAPNAVQAGKLSDGYHSYNELYAHRMQLFAVVCKQNQALAWKSKLHHDGSMLPEYFIVGLNTPEGQFTYHYHADHWNLFDVVELDNAPKWDGHTADDVTRLHSLLHVKMVEHELLNPVRSSLDKLLDTRIPILDQIYDLCQAIEKCGASPELTDAVTKAGDLRAPISELVEQAIALGIGEGIVSVSYSNDGSLQAADIPELNLFSFSMALDLLKQGNKICRKGWNGANQWLSISCPETKDVAADNFWSPHNAEFARQNGGSAKVAPCITLKNAQGMIIMGWIPSAGDLFANDWMIAQ